MYYGHYFRLETEIANIEKGMAVFRYCPDGKTDSRIYVTFSSEEIEFRSLKTIDGISRNASILRLYIDEHIEQNFIDIITAAFQWKAEEMGINPDDITYLSYYSTFYFGHDSKHRDSWKKPCAAATYGSPSIPEPRTVRKLILDFLFDLLETSIFQMSPHCDKLKEKLHQNFFTRSLMAKARYCYRRACYQETQQRDAQKKRGRLLDKKQRKMREKRARFYGEMLFHAEKDWAERIRDLRSDQTFYDEKYDWFDDSETEMCRIYRPYLPLNLGEGVLRELKMEQDKLTSKWFVARHSALAAWQFFLRGRRSFFGLHLFWPRLCLTIGAAWFPLVISRDTKNFVETINDSFFVIPFIVVITLVSWIIVRRVVPLVNRWDIFCRAIKLTLLVLLISGLVGLGVALADKESFDPQAFPFYWISAAFIGLVLQIFLKGDNPTEPL